MMIKHFPPFNNILSLILYLCSCNLYLNYYSWICFIRLWLDTKWKHVVLWNRATAALCCPVAKSMWLEQRCIMPGICASVLGVSALWPKQCWAGSGGSSVSLCHSPLRFSELHISVSAFKWNRRKNKSSDSVLVWFCLLVCWASGMEEGGSGKLVVIRHAIWKLKISDIQGTVKVYLK